MKAKYKFPVKGRFIENIKPEIIKASYYELSDEEIEQTAHYIWLYKSNNCDEHYEVNNIINQKNSWDEFTAIRSLNDHGYRKRIKGITPKFFAIICKVLDITGDDGATLKEYEIY